MVGVVKVKVKLLLVELLLNVAAHAFAVSIVNVAVGLLPALAQSPVQLVKVAPVSGVAVKVRLVPVEKELEHAVPVVPQSIPVG